MKADPSSAKTFSGVVGAWGMRPTNKTMVGTLAFKRNSRSAKRKQRPSARARPRILSQCRKWRARMDLRDSSRRSVVQVVVVIMPLAVLVRRPRVEPYDKADSGAAIHSRSIIRILVPTVYRSVTVGAQADANATARS